MGRGPRRLDRPGLHRRRRGRCPDHRHHAGHTHRVTGPEPLRPANRVEILGEVLGRPLRFEAQSDEQARAEMLADGVPPHIVDAFFRFFSAGETDESIVTPAVEEVTGRPAGTFARWAAAHASEFA